VLSFQIFRRTPTPEDWARFIPYARRVRSLEFRKYPSRLLADSVFDDLARTRTTLEVLPNLRRLCWDVPPYLIPDPRNAIVFMHDKVTEFSFDADYDNDELHSLATDIVGRMPFLVSLKCKRSYGSHDPAFDQELLQLLSSLQRLQENYPNSESCNLIPWAGYHPSSLPQ